MGNGVPRRVFEDRHVWALGEGHNVTPGTQVLSLSYRSSPSFRAIDERISLFLECGLRRPVRA